MLSEEINIELILIPYHPLVYSHLETNYSIINTVEDYISQLSKSYNLKISGSYNPNNFLLQSMDFYDGMHLKEESIEKIL